MYKDVPKHRIPELLERIEENRVKDYKCPRTKEEYWEVVNQYWPQLSEIILRFVHNSNVNIEEIDKFKEAQDLKLIEFFHLAWYHAPDVGYIHAIPGWPILCDLCSEDELVRPEEPPQATA